MAVKYNLDSIKQEMESKRNERNSVSQQLGESVNSNQPKDGFLNGLLTSFKTGRETHATKRIKMIENKVDLKEGKVPKFKETTNNEDLVEISNNRNRNILPIDNDRDELMYNDLNKKVKNNQSLSESLMNVSVPVSNNRNLNENTLTEGVKNVVNNYLAENFNLIVEESIKMTTLEMYAVDRIKQVINENKSIIKTIVLEVLRDLKEKQKR
jgi:hypothetical protein